MRRVTSPIVLIHPEGKRRCVDGMAAAEAVFEKKSRVVEVKDIDGEIELALG